MSHMESALYSAYGGYELKSKYQRNFAFGTMITTSFVLLILIVAWLVQQMQSEVAISDQPVVIRTIADLGPPPTLAATGIGHRPGQDTEAHGGQRTGSQVGSRAALWAYRVVSGKR